MRADPNLPPEPAHDSPSTSRARLAVLGAALAFYAVFIWRTSFVALGTRYFVLFEDAMISMRYARNFQEGAGLTWNAGEGRVEGYTNLLWTLWMSAGHAIGLSEAKVSLFIMLTGVAVLVGNALVAERIARYVSPHPLVPLATLAAVLFCYPLVFWTLRGMEVGAVALALHSLLLLALSIEREHGYGKALAMAGIGAASVLLRTDTALSIALFGAYAAWVSPKGKRLLTLFLVGGGAGAALVGHTAFRLSYYDERVPNTAHLKLAHIPLSARVKRGVFVSLQVLGFHLGVPLSALAAALGARLVVFGKGRFEPENRRYLLLATFVLVQFAYAINVGGDAWEWMLYANRYTSAAMPALIVLVTALGAKLFARLAEHPEQTKQALKHFGLALLGFALLLFALSAFAKLRPEEGIARTIVFSKKVAAVGALFLLLGGAVVALAGTLQDKLLAAARRLNAGHGALLFALALWLPAHAEGLAFWAKSNAAQYADEARYSRLGLVLQHATPKDFRIAVVAAGATPYFAQRPTEDLLGKNDKVIAKQAPRGVFSPGHDKWDYQHSLGAQNPSLIVELSDVTEEDLAYVHSLGFEQLPNELWLRKTGTQPTDREALAAPFDTDAELDQTLTRLGVTL